ncbi:cytochrome c family protein [Desulfovibrio sp. OttesenSCG-928-G15]|nr:cytochrome c family protein [Desulfovibrio sp. OttesenSCG-928-G15]
MALAFGWWVFPDLIFSKQSQPFYFSHKVHIETVGASCADCHSFRADGSFTGYPDMQSCANCHSDVLTPKPGPGASKAELATYEAEKTFVEEYVKTGAEVPWAKHQKQPDNVFFSHAAHFSKCFSCHLTMKGDLNLGRPESPEKLCMTCHPSLEELDKNIPVEVNVLTDYSRTTMKMWECEKCHAHPGHFYNDGKGRTAANNACYTCHK